MDKLLIDSLTSFLISKCYHARKTPHADLSRELFFSFVKKNFKIATVCFNHTSFDVVIFQIHEYTQRGYVGYLIHVDDLINKPTVHITAATKKRLLAIDDDLKLELTDFILDLSFDLI